MDRMAKRRETMVKLQLKARGIDDPRVLQAFASVPRERFVPASMREQAYEDGPLPIGEGQTISQPYIVARMIVAAAIGPRARVLEIGAGSGYAAAVIARIAARVIAIERHNALARAARARIEALGYANCSIVAGDGMDGSPGEAPFDAVLVAARAERVPEPLLRQLATGGRLVIPIGDEAMQSLRCYERTGEEEWRSEDIAPVRFVPLLPGVAQRAD